MGKERGIGYTYTINPYNIILWTSYLVQDLLGIIMYLTHKAKYLVSSSDSYNLCSGLGTELANTGCTHKHTSTPNLQSPNNQMDWCFGCINIHRGWLFSQQSTPTQPLVCFKYTQGITHTIMCLGYLLTTFNGELSNCLTNL